ncbi:MAG TPA: hypothetical protein DIV40_09050, partial [Clostridiales bacterium]|nr:hypothetical protein [Clostridiales bacterium]
MKLSKWADKNAGYILILPAVIIIVLFSIAPIIGTLRYSFFDMQLNNQAKNDMYMKSNINIALNQETINYLNYYLSIDMELVQNQDTIAKIDEIIKDLSELENFIAEEIAPIDLKSVVQVGKAEQNALTERQQSIVNKLDELYVMDDEFYSPEDTMAVASEFDTSIIKSNFSGEDNFTKVLKDERVHSTLTFTLSFTVISVFAELIFGLALALIMN